MQSGFIIVSFEVSDEVSEMVRDNEKGGVPTYLRLAKLT
jgi:hypothetical protein